MIQRPNDNWLVRIDRVIGPYIEDYRPFATRRSRAFWAIVGVVVVLFFLVNTCALMFPAPAASNVPPQYRDATAICNSGKISYSKSRMGTCSWNGGVRLWLR